MKLTVEIQGADWSRKIDHDCNTASGRHYGARSGHDMVVMCEFAGEIKRFPKAPPGALLVAVEQPARAKCSRCGKLLKSTGAGTVHARNGKRGCW